MSRFYFHVATTDEFVPDYEGSDLQSLAQCHNHALKVIRECLPYVQTDQRRWWIQVADRHGKDVLTVLYPCRVAFGRRCQPDKEKASWSDLLMGPRYEVDCRWCGEPIPPPE
jgi:hypothetical protein